MADTSWNSTTLPQPDAEGGISIQRQRIGGSRRMLSGTLRVDAIATKAQIRLRWTNLASSPFTTLYNAYTTNRDTSTTLALRDGTSFSVIAAEDGLQYDEIYDSAGAPYYTATLVCNEV